LYALSGSVNYAFGNHFMAGFSTNIFNQSDTNSDKTFNMSGATIDLGYYIVDKESNRRFEVMAGYGGGELSTRSDIFTLLGFICNRA